jgi:hypothetical protein
MRAALRQGPSRRQIGASDLADERSLKAQCEKALMRRMTDMTVQQGLASVTPAQVGGFMIK